MSMLQENGRPNLEGEYNECLEEELKAYERRLDSISWTYNGITVTLLKQRLCNQKYSGGQKKLKTLIN